jgi:hypothetical protein
MSDGASPAHIQRMLGHSSIKLTVDLYGKWLPMVDKAAVNRLDDPVPGQVVGDAVAGGPGVVDRRTAASKISRSCGRGGRRQPPKSFLSDSRNPPTSGPSSSPEDTRWYSSRSSRCLPVSFFGTSTTTV